MLAGANTGGAKESAAAGQTSRNAQSQKTPSETQDMSSDPANDAANDAVSRGRPSSQSGSTETDAGTAQTDRSDTSLSGEDKADTAIGDDALVSAPPEAGAPATQAAQTDIADPVPAENAGEAETAGDMKAGDAMPAGAPGGDGTQAASTPTAGAKTSPQAGQSPSNTAQQAQGASTAAPGNTPASAPPQPAQSQTNAPVDASANETGETASAEEGVTNAAAIRRELERGPGRDNAIAASERASVAKAEAGAKDATPRDTGAPKANTAQPMPPAATSPQAPANAAPQPLPAMLMALQSGMAAPETLDPSLGSSGEEIRLETGSALAARSESSAAQGARSATALLHLRMASGQAAELGQMIARRFANGSRSFDIRLDPPELGRVQVRMEIGADRTVQAMLTAEKPEALAELQRHARELEKALADAGLDLGENGLGFALSEGNEQAGQGGSQSDRAAPAPDEHTITLADQSTPAPVSRYGFLMTGRAGVNMRV